MKKVITMLLAVCLVLGLSVGVFAAKVTPTVDKNVVKAGEQVKVTLSLDKQLENVTTLNYRLYFNADLFDYTSKVNSTGISYSVSTVKKDAEGSYVEFSCIDPESEGYTLPVGKMLELTFTAKADVTGQNATFTAKYDNSYDTSYVEIPGLKDEEPVSVTVTVKPASSAASGYAAAVSGTAEIKVGENADVKVTVSSAAESTFNAYDFTLSYDAKVLEYKSVSLTGATVTTGTGTVRIQGYGADKACATPITVTFTGKAGGASDVTLTDARFDKSTNAIDKDAPAAAITGSAKITVNASYSVNLPADFNGAEAVTPGADYTFTAKDTHYDYDFTGSTMGGSAATVVDNGDGTFTVKSVTGELDITATKTPKSYGVTVTGTGAVDVTAEANASYASDYSFTLNKAENYDYTVSVTVGGAAYTPTLAEDGKTYTIAGNAITGAIVISVTKTEKTPENTTINFTGSGSADVAGGTTQTGKTGEDFAFSINQAEGYTYTVTLGGETLTAVGGVYTIPGAKLQGKDLTVTVEKTSNAVVSVTEYLKLSGKNVYLVTVTGAAGEGKAFAYAGNVMCTSEKYGAAYLVIADKPLTAAEAKAKVTVVTAAAEAIAYTGDVNGSGKVDVNDAQLVYDLYNAKYDSFTSVSMLKLLRADVNGDKTVDTKDAAAVINLAR